MVVTCSTVCGKDEGNFEVLTLRSRLVNYKDFRRASSASSLKLAVLRMKLQILKRTSKHAFYEKDFTSERQKT